MSQKPFSSLVFCTLASLVMGLAPASGAAVPLTSATVTRIENKASIGTVKNGQIVGERGAVVSDVIGSSSIFQTSSNGRAELEFANKSLIRLGPNSVFSFDSSSRTVSLEKGNMLFYLPPGQGGVKIKTASATAALTGTVVAVTQTGIAVLEGSFTLTYTVNGVTTKLTLTAGTAQNAATYNPATGAYVPSYMDPLNPTEVTADLANTATNLVSFAALPDNAEIQIAASTPTLADAVAAADLDLNQNKPGTNKTNLDAILDTVQPLSGFYSNTGTGSAGAGVTVTRVVDGKIAIFSEVNNLLTFVGFQQ